MTGYCVMTNRAMALSNEETKLVVSYAPSGSSGGCDVVLSQLLFTR